MGALDTGRGGGKGGQGRERGGGRVIKGPGSGPRLCLDARFVGREFGQDLVGSGGADWENKKGRGLGVGKS